MYWFLWFKSQFELGKTVFEQHDATECFVYREEEPDQQSLPSSTTPPPGNPRVVSVWCRHLKNKNAKIALHYALLGSSNSFAHIYSERN